MRWVLELGVDEVSVPTTLKKTIRYCVVLEPVGHAIAAHRAFIDRAKALLGRGMVQALD